MATYHGSCHCGAITFSFVDEAITSGLRCNCSICRRRGAVMSERYYRPDEITVTGTPLVYHFGDVMVNHYFCATCGVHPFHDAIAKPGHYRVNLGCVDGIDTFALAVRVVDGASY